MRPLQVVVTSTLLLICIHLSLAVAVGAMPSKAAPVQRDGEAFWCSHSIVANQTDIIQKAHKEAMIVIRIVGYLLERNPYDTQYPIAGLKDNRKCDPIVLPPPPRSAFNSTLQYTADAFWNLTHLLQLYHSVWRLMELHEGDSVGSDLAKLDFLEIVFSRFSNQVERYLHVHRCSCKGINCNMHQDINKESIRNVMEMEFSSAGCSRKVLLGKIIADFRKEATTTYISLNHHDLPAVFVPWPVCATVKANPIEC